HVLSKRSASPRTRLLGLADRRSGSSPGRARSGHALPSTSETPGGSSAVTLAMTTLVVALSESSALRPKAHSRKLESRLVICRGGPGRSAAPGLAVETVALDHQRAGR